MEITLLRIFRTVAEEGSFSRAAQKLLRTQPAVSLAVKRLEDDLGVQLIDRSSRTLVLTDAGNLALDYAKRFDGLERQLRRALTELRGLNTGKLTIGANESTALYLLKHLEAFRRRHSRIDVELRRSLSSRIPEAVLEGAIELGAISYDPKDPRLKIFEFYNDRLTFVVSPKHRLAGRRKVSIRELGEETFIAHNVVSPYRVHVIETFREHQAPLNMAVEMPTIETIRRLVQRNLGVAFLPKMCVEQEIRNGTLKQVQVRELAMERKIRLVYPARRKLSQAAGAFLDLVGEAGESAEGEGSESAEAGG